MGGGQVPPAHPRLEGSLATVTVSLFQPQYGEGKEEKCWVSVEGRRLPPLPHPFPLLWKSHEVALPSNGRGCVGVKWGLLGGV